MKTAAAAASVLIAHVLYVLITDQPAARSQWFYVLRGVGGAILYGLLSGYIGQDKGMRPLSRRFAVVICWEGAFEEIQTAACGIGSLNLPIVGAGLCVERFGVIPYALIGATAALYLWIHHAQGNRRD